jgi:glycosyltransferase involved in cell wall biosynthesis
VRRSRPRSVRLDEPSWPAVPPAVVPESALPAQPSLPRIKVLHVITRFWAGAGGNTLLSAVGMDPDRYEAWVTGCPGGPLWERARRAGVGTVELRRFREVLAPFDDLYVLVQLVRLMRRERFTIVHTHSAKGGFLGRLAAWLCRTPVVVHTFHGFSVHDFMSRRRRRVYLLLDRAVGRMAHAFFAVSPRVAQQAVQLRFAPPGSVSVVPSAIELDAIPRDDAASVLAELGIPAGVPVVGTVGRIDFAKAPLDFIRMAAKVAQTHPGSWFVMVGDGPLEDEARQEAQRLGVRVLFTGFRSDAPRVAAAFDVFVISSLYEGLGRAVTEALASGRPVVATAVNGVPDLIVAGSTGLLAPPAEPAALADCVRWLLDHPAEARRMGQQGRERVLAAFAPAVMCRLLDRAYTRLLGLPVPAEPSAIPIELSPTTVEPAAVDTGNGRRPDPDERVAVHHAE